MSKSLFVEYRGQGFWAFDVVTSVLLKHLVDVAAPRIPANGPWLGEVVHKWRVDTILPDCFGVNLDETWSDSQIDVVISLIAEACDVVGQREGIPAAEIEHWGLLDGERLFARGIPVVDTKSVIKLGRAIISLLRGTLPPAPHGTWWWYGCGDDPTTIAKRE
jgi:hypothetical protein